MAARKRVVLPDPLGPIRTVGAPAEIWIEIPSRIVTPPARIPTSESKMGRSEAGIAVLIPSSVRRHGALPRPER